MGEGSWDGEDGTTGVLAALANGLRSGVVDCGLSGV